ncbi:hypothetical protein D3C81_2170150 [compost metagenome]
MVATNRAKAMIMSVVRISILRFFSTGDRMRESGIVTRVVQPVCFDTVYTAR